MSKPDINNSQSLGDELLNYELGDDIDDQALLGADEDELLLSDEELEQDVSKEEKQRIKAEAEQWVKLQIEDQKGDVNNQSKVQVKSFESDIKTESVETIPKSTNETTEVSSTAPQSTTAAVVQMYSADVTTSVELSKNVDLKLQIPSKQQQELQVLTTKPEILPSIEIQKTSNADEVTSSCSNQIELDHSSITSCSTNVNTDSSTTIQSSQESFVETGSVSSNYTDLREDIDDDREERTNIKTTNERDVETANSSSPEKNRYVPNKRVNYQQRPHVIRSAPYQNQRPILRYPTYGQSPIQQPPNLFTSHTTHTSPVSGPGVQQPQNLNTHGSQIQHDPMNPNHLPRLRNPYPGFRPPGPISFRHPSPTGMYAQVPHDYNSNSGTTYNQNFVQNTSQPPRPIFRPEMNAPPGVRPGMRIQRPPLQSIPPQNYVNGPTIRHPQAPQLSAPAVSVGIGTPASVPNSLPTVLPVSSLQQTPALRPSKVLINPNFKGGVEAATTKFIKETQFMHSISNHVSHLQSDEELLRQQEEFINNNRQHIEKRRNKRSPTPTKRRSRSHSRSRSRSRNRSLSPPKRSGGGGHFERGNASSNNDRFVDRERFARANSRDRDRGFNSAAGNRGNRFRRGHSRDFESRNQSGNYGKRRRSMSPSSIRNGNRRAPDRERNDVEEDEETRAYRLEIEKQKTLREKILRDKELKRRRNLEEKLHEDKRGTQTNSNNSSNQQKTNAENQQSLTPQKLKPIIVTERRIISLKKRQQQQRDNLADNRHKNTSQQQQKQPTQSQSQLQSQSRSKPQPQSNSQTQSHSQPQTQQQQQSRSHSQSQSQSQARGKAVPMAKILPEAKRTLTDHLTNAKNIGVANTAGSSSSSVSASGNNSTSSNTKAVQKKDVETMQKFNRRRLSSPSDDEVELDFDEDELMLEEEDRLLATPTPSPPPIPPTQTKNMKSRSPTPPAELPPKINNADARNKNTNSKSRANAKSPFTTNRRVILKSSPPKESYKSRRGNNNSREHYSSGNSSGSSSRKGIFDRLDARKQVHNSSNDEKRKSRRIVIKHD